MPGSDVGEVHGIELLTTWKDFESIIDRNGRTGQTRFERTLPAPFLLYSIVRNSPNPHLPFDCTSENSVTELLIERGGMLDILILRV